MVINEKYSRKTLIFNDKLLISINLLEPLPHEFQVFIFQPYVLPYLKQISIARNHMHMIA